MERKDIKTNRAEALPRVAAEVHAKILSKRQAAKEFGIPEFTLRHFLKKSKNHQMVAMGIAQH